MLPARGTPGVSPDGERSWDAAAVVAAAAAAAAVSRLEIQVDILAGELYLEFAPNGIGPWWKFWTLGVRGFAQNFDTFQMGTVVWPGKAILRQSENTKRIHLFFKHGHVQTNPEVLGHEKERRKHTGGPMTITCIFEYVPIFYCIFLVFW